MLTINATPGPSAIHGTGLFTRQFIAEGDVVWRFDPMFDRTFSEPALSALSPEFQKAVRYYGSFSEGLWLYDIGDAKYMNHADAPNVVTGPGTSYMVAARDIEAGEELTCNYDTFHVGAR